MGVFLGTYSGSDLGKTDEDKLYACFAANNPFGLTSACSFTDSYIALEYISDTFAPNKRGYLNILEVESESEYPDVIDIIKAGHSEYTHDMLDELFHEEIENPTIH
jgi:hypothetical protein